MPRIALAAVLVSALAGSAAAQEADTVIQEPDRVVFRKLTPIDFGVVDVDGDRARPEGTYLLALRRVRFDTLMRARADFLPELQRSVDEL